MLETIKEKFKSGFNRIWFESLMLFGLFTSALLVPSVIFPTDAKLGFITLFLIKFLSVSAGILHAHISRKLIFPYIDFKIDGSWHHNILIIAWYITIIFAWARGG